MRLINCPECNEKISKEVSVCPHCGKPCKTKNKSKGLIIIGMLGILMGIVGLFISVKLGGGLCIVSFIIFLMGRSGIGR